MLELRNASDQWQHGDWLMEEQWQTLKHGPGVRRVCPCVSLFVFSGGIIGYLSDLHIETFVTNCVTQCQYPSSNIIVMDFNLARTRMRMWINASHSNKSKSNFSSKLATNSKVFERDGNMKIYLYIHDLTSYNYIVLHFSSVILSFFLNWINFINLYFN